jgi:galactokinase
VREHGVANNWAWWSFLLTGMASAFGAGFGGAVWAAAPAADASAVSHQWRSAYVQRFAGRAAQVWAGVMEPASGMHSTR